jgi:hypothetical protein
VGLHDRARLLLYTVHAIVAEHSQVGLGAIRRRAIRKQPEDVPLSRAEGEALMERSERKALSTEDRQLLVKILTFYFGLLFALREAKLRLNRLKVLGFGEKPKKPNPPRQGGPLGVEVRPSGQHRQTQHKTCCPLLVRQGQSRKRRPRGLGDTEPT